MPLLIPFLAGAGTTAYAWWQVESEDGTPVNDGTVDVGLGGVSIPYKTLALAGVGYLIYKKVK